MYVKMPLHLACKCMCTYILKKKYIIIKTKCKCMYRCPGISHVNVCVYKY